MLCLNHADVLKVVSMILKVCHRLAQEEFRENGTE
jgi:hypothetical protein